MKNLIRKWLGINRCVTYDEYCELIKRIEAIKVKTEQLDEFGPLPENSNLYHIINRLIAIQEYLKLDIKWEWQNDPNRLPEPHPQIKVWKAYERKTKQPTH